jgi:hypothetical protein
MGNFPRHDTTLIIFYEVGKSYLAEGIPQLCPGFHPDPVHRAVGTGMARFRAQYTVIEKYFADYDLNHIQHGKFLGGNEKPIAAFGALLNLNYARSRELLGNFCQKMGGDIAAHSYILTTDKLSFSLSCQAQYAPYSIFSCSR